MHPRSRSHPTAGRALALLACLTLPVAVPLVGVAHAAPTEERPRIGLVLSGGGARGAAHIGVIRALEEMLVQIEEDDCTSMGDEVGGLY